VQLEQHVSGCATQMAQTPPRQPVGQIVQRHGHDSATRMIGGVPTSSVIDLFMRR